MGTPDDSVDGGPLEAYRDGKSAKDAQFDVKRYGSHQYTSHRKVWHEGLMNLRLLIRHIFLYLVIKGPMAKSMLTLNL